MNGFTREWYDDYRKKVSSKNRPTIPSPNLEQTICLSSLAEKEIKRLDTQGRRYILLIKSYRHRLCDADGISAKACIDGLVLCGLLSDDSPKVIKEVAYEQTQIPKEELEYTTIEVWQ